MSSILTFPGKYVHSWAIPRNGILTCMHAARTGWWRQCPQLCVPRDTSFLDKCRTALFILRALHLCALSLAQDLGVLPGSQQLRQVHASWSQISVQQCLCSKPGRGSAQTRSLREDHLKKSGALSINKTQTAASLRAWMVPCKECVHEYSNLVVVVLNKASFSA